jgi:hypothetical protein
VLWVKLPDTVAVVPEAVFVNLKGSFRVPGCWETEERLVGLTDL